MSQAAVDHIQTLGTDGAFVYEILNFWWKTGLGNSALANLSYLSARRSVQSLALLRMAFDRESIGVAVERAAADRNVFGMLNSRVRTLRRELSNIPQIPQLAVPARRSPPRFGIGEQVFVNPAAVYPDWSHGYLCMTVTTATQQNGSIDKLTGPSNAGKFRFTAGLVAGATGDAVVELQLKSATHSTRVLATLTFTVIRPTGISMREIPNSQIHHTGAEAHPRRLAGPWNPDPNGGFYAKHVLTPDDVSFGRLELHELGHGAVWTAEVGAGTIAVFGPTGTALLGQTHGTPNGARPGTTDMEKWFWGDMPPLLSAPITHSAMYNHHLPGVGTVIGKDKVYNAILGVRNQFVDSDIPETVVHAGAYIEIELHARISGATAGANAAEIPNYRLGTNTHRIQLTRNGTLTISKGGISETFRRDHPNLGDPAPP